MAHLWVEGSWTGHGEPEWVVQPLAGKWAVPLPAARTAALLLCSRAAAGESWLIMNVVPAGVALNGAPLRTGIRTLADRDEIRIAGLGRVFYSSERLAQVQPFPGADRRVDCSRCVQEMLPGTPAVCCPRCERWMHMSTELPCWSYAETCLCPQPTTLNAGYQWTPNGL
jgi:hypothetical protein